MDTDMLFILLGAIVGGVGFRIRGAAAWYRWTGRGATSARIFAWALPLAFVTYLAGASLELAVALGVALWVGCLPGWWGSIDMGRDEGPWLKDAVLQALRGLVWTLPAAAVVGYAIGIPEALIVFAAGAATLPVYELGWRVYPKGATEVGEALFGAVVGTALLAVIV